MGSEVGSVNSQQMDNFLSDIILLLFKNDNICSSIVAKMIKTHNYEVLHYLNLNDAFGAMDDKDNSLKLILTSIGIAGSIGNEMIMPVVFFPEKDKGVLIQALEGDGGVTMYHIKSVNMDDLEDIWHHIFVHKQRKKVDFRILDKHPVQNNADSTSTSVNRDIQQPKGSSGGSGVAKKARVVWTIELNNRFIEAYNQLGHQGATPCRILELMNDPRLTRFHIASHLQKYRAHLREMQEDLNPRRSKFSYKVNNPKLSSVNPSMPLEHANYDPPVNPGASFTKYVSNMEEEELFALSLSPARSSDVDLADRYKFDEIHSTFQRCVSGEPFSTSYVGFKISNRGELVWDTSKSSPQPAGMGAKMDMQLHPSPHQELPGLVESPVTFDMEMLDFDIYELLDFDSNVH